MIDATKHQRDEKKRTTTNSPVELLSLNFELGKVCAQKLYGLKIRVPVGDCHFSRQNVKFTVLCRAPNKKVFFCATIFLLYRDPNHHEIRAARNNKMRELGYGRSAPAFQMGISNCRFLSPCFPPSTWYTDYMEFTVM
jgi:hypothetical protein